MNAKGLGCWVGPHLHLKLARNRSAAFTLPFPWLLVELNSLRKTVLWKVTQFKV